jgi:hypothetical protein
LICFKINLPYNEHYFAQQKGNRCYFVFKLGGFGNLYHGPNLNKPIQSIITLLVIKDDASTWSGSEYLQIYLIIGLKLTSPDRV